MKRSTIQRSILPLSMAVMVGIPAGNAWAATQHSASAAKSQTFKGSLEQMQQWGPIRVSIVVKSKKITKVNVSASAHTDRSTAIQANALPILKSETLKAQSAKLNEVSGATDTSGAYITSLQAAVKAAKKVKALK